MFPFETLAPGIATIAKDIELNHGAVLREDATVWQKIAKLVSAPKE